MNRSIADIKARVSIFDLLGFLGSTTEEHESGWHDTACPFCLDKTAAVSPDGERFFCFRGCGTRGDVIDLAQAHLQQGSGLPIRIREAIRWLERTFLHSAA